MYQNIYLVSRNPNGSIEIRGFVGFRVYYFYSITEAKKRYTKECMNYRKFLKKEGIKR